jgi:phospholipid/cholesterol/gamma-HCH transport system substrate-binding protein
MRNEIKVGVFIFLGLVSLMFLTLQVNSLQDFNKKGYTLYALMNDASGLSKKAKVKMRGVDIGSVDALTLTDRGVKLKLIIKKEVKIPLNSTVTLAQDNFLGGKYVKIIPSDEQVYYAKNQEIKKYLVNASMEDVMNNVNSAVDDIKVLIGKLNKTLDERTINNIKETMANVKDASVTLKSILNSTDQKLPKLLNNANNMVLEYKKAGVTLNEKLPDIVKKTDNLLTKFNKTGDTLNEKLGPLIDEYTKLGKNANSILNDNKNGIKEAVVSAKKFFVNGGESFKKIDDYLSSLTKSQILVDIQSNYMFKDDYFKTSAYISYLPVPTKYYIFGVTSSKDYSDLSKINLSHQEDKLLISAEYGKRFDDLLLRGGIIENTGGLGVDYYFNHDRFKLSSEIYDFNAVNDVRGNEPHLTVKGTYTYLKHIQFTGGVDNVLNTDARVFFLGVGVKFKDNDLKTLLSGGASSFLK